MSFGSQPSEAMLLPLLRADKLTDWPCTVVSEAPVTLSTHYLKRTLVCPGEPECGLCQIGKPTTWYCFLVGEHGGSPFLLRLTSRSMRRVRLADLSCGRALLLNRRAARRSLRLELRDVKAVERVWTQLQLLHVVARLHHLPAVRFDESLAANEDRLRRAAAINCRTLMDEVPLDLQA